MSSARVRQMILKVKLAAEKFGRDLIMTAKAVAEVKKRKTTPGPSPLVKSTGRAVRRKRV